MNTLALNAQSPQPTATAESNNVAASDTTSSSDSSPVDTFLTLFVAEIQNQDPTDATEYIDQLSSMAQVAMMEEMSVQANTNAVLMSNIQVMALGNLVGDDIMVQTTALQVVTRPLTVALRWTTPVPPPISTLPMPQAMTTPSR